MELFEEQESKFQEVMQESKNCVQNLEQINAGIRTFARAYYEASENAEKFIFHYQDLKLNVEMPL